MRASGSGVNKRLGPVILGAAFFFLSVSIFFSFCGVNSNVVFEGRWMGGWDNGEPNPRNNRPVRLHQGMKREPSCDFGDGGSIEGSRRRHKVRGDD
jgi:hypothetical protein